MEEFNMDDENIETNEKNLGGNKSMEYQEEEDQTNEEPLLLIDFSVSDVPYCRSGFDVAYRDSEGKGEKFDNKLLDEMPHRTYDEEQNYWGSETFILQTQHYISTRATDLINSDEGETEARARRCMYFARVIPRMQELVRKKNVVILNK